VDLIHQTTNPDEACFGCVGSQVFPLAPAYRATGRDSLWVVWGGNSISDPVIYWASGPAGAVAAFFRALARQAVVHEAATPEAVIALIEQQLGIRRWRAV
jgi:hypothetical protein